MIQHKDQIRALLRARRQQFTAQAGAAPLYIHAIVMARMALWLADGRQSIAGYLSNGREVDAMPALELACARGIETALPHIESKGAIMRFLRWRPGDPLQPGPYGTAQPTNAAPEIAPEALLTPLVGFDRHGHRLGQGGGYYDRAFAALPDARRIGLAWSVQEIDTIPVASWDVPLHAVVTERKWISFE